MKTCSYIFVIVSLLTVACNKTPEKSKQKENTAIEVSDSAFTNVNQSEAQHKNKYYKKVRQEIEGYVKDGGNANIILDEMDIGVINPIISVVIAEDGSFRISTDIPEPGIYQLRFANGNIHLFLRGGTVKVRTDIANIGGYTIEGSPESVHLKEMYLILSEVNNKTYALQDRVEELKKDKKNNKQLIALVDSLPIYYDALIKEKSRRLTDFIERIDTSMVALLAAFYLDPDVAYEEIVKVKKRFETICPHSKFYIQLEEKVSKIVPTGPGNKAVDILVADKDGKEHSLSETLGKITLLYYWSSYSQPCREDNLVLKEIYQKYKNKNFGIFAVSIDEEKEPWIKAMGEDGIGDWINVSNIQGWDDDVANIYRIGAIPYYILIDRDGIIVNRGFKVYELEDLLQTLM